MGTQNSKISPEWIKKQKFEVVGKRTDKLNGTCLVIKFPSMPKLLFIKKSLNPAVFENLAFSNEALQ